MSFLRKAYNYYLSPKRNFVKKITPILGFIPSNLSIFELAFVHKSKNAEQKKGVQNNERLEYLGDAVLGTIVAEYLFNKYPGANEGFLTKMRSKIVMRKSLNKIGYQMGLDVLLNDFNTTKLSNSMLGNAVEALIGSVYIERGYKKTRRFIIKRILRDNIDIHELETVDDNYKSQLLEWCQKNNKTISYELLSRFKFQKRDRFRVAVLVAGEKIATAEDFNKKSAEQIASKKAMKILGLLNVDEIAT